jgi:hypothetical protein
MIKMMIFSNPIHQHLCADFENWQLDSKPPPFIMKTAFEITTSFRDDGRVSYLYTLVVFYKPDRNYNRNIEEAEAELTLEEKGGAHDTYVRG